MTAARRPRVVIVDDHPDQIAPLKVELDEFLNATVRAPSDISQRDLKRSSLVLIDYQLDEWPTRDVVGEISLQPRTGLALAAVLRSHLAAEVTQIPVAFGLISGRLAELAGGLPPQDREHVIARCHNLEWVFAKHATGGRPTLVRQIVSLAKAVVRLPAEWPRDDATLMMARVRSLLGLRRGDVWHDRAWQDIEKCRPAFHELATATHGLAFLRWLLQRILPYPCFLVGSPYLAARLYVTPVSLRNALAADKRFRAKLKATKYSGILADFEEDRWWRAGIESFVWRITKRRPFDRQALLTAARKLSPALEPVDQNEPVVCVDDRFSATEELVELDEAVEIQPDDWPSYADRAWVRLEEAREDPRIMALVVIRERDRVNEAGLGAQT